MVSVDATQAHLHVRSTERNGANIVSYSLQLICSSGASRFQNEALTISMLHSGGEGKGDVQSERKQQAAPVWCDLVVAAADASEEAEEERLSTDDKEPLVDEDEDGVGENWVLGWRDLAAGQTFTWEATEKQPVVVTNGCRVRERLAPGTLCEARDSDGKWKPAIVDRDMLAYQQFDAASVCPGAGPYLVTFLEEMLDHQTKGKKSKRRNRGGVAVLFVFG